MRILQVALESDHIKRQELLPPKASHLLLRDEQSLLNPGGRIDRHKLLGGIELQCLQICAQ